MVFFIFPQILIEHSVRNCGDPDQTPHSVASDLGLHCFAYIRMSHKMTLGLYGLSQLVQLHVRVY